MYLLRKLYETYRKNEDSIGRWDKKVIGKDKDKKDIEKEIVPLLPYGHSTQHAHITVVLNKKGEIKGARVNGSDDTNTIIPVTEKSSARTAGVVPHALFDKLQYVAGDYLEYGGEAKRFCYPAYLKQLEAWSEYDKDNEVLAAILAYERKGTLIKDLIALEVLVPDDKGGLLSKWTGEKNDTPPIFGAKALSSQYDAFVRWEVQIPGQPESRVWAMKDVRDSWAKFMESNESEKGLCYVAGKEAVLAKLHPSKVRNAGDGAKIISSNDSSGFTFRGRFIDADEVCGVSSEVTQKAHSALRWLISRQGKIFESLAVVAWSPGYTKVSSPFMDDRDWTARDDEGTSFLPAKIFAQLVEGYEGNISAEELFEEFKKQVEEGNEPVLVVSLDSATPGRMAVTYFNDLLLSDYYRNMMEWYANCRWEQFLSKDNRPTRAPEIKRIGEAAYGPGTDRQTVRRLLPCIIEGQRLPKDIVDSCVRRAAQRVNMEWWQWEQQLGVCCALYSYYSYQENNKKYEMKLNEEESDRSYLYGRLLALAEYIEKSAGDMERQTHAERMTLPFYERPHSMWVSLEKVLAPYLSILSKRPSTARLYRKVKARMDRIISTFELGEFEKEGVLDGAYLIGYYCEKKSLFTKSEKIETSKSEENREDVEEETEQKKTNVQPQKEVKSCGDLGESRDYLLGRLLAVAEETERAALVKSEDGEITGLRPGPYEKFIQNFLTQPVNVWEMIEKSLSVFLSMIMKSSRGPKAVYSRKKALDNIMSHLKPHDFSDKKVSEGLVLLGYHHQRNGGFELPQIGEERTIPDLDCKDRSYLFGRLLGLAEYYEYKSLHMSRVNATDIPGELPPSPRVTNADRLISSFASSPAETWEFLGKFLVGAYLKKHAGMGWEEDFLKREKEINALFLPSEQKNNEKLSPVFLLGYHHERFYLKNRKGSSES